MSKYTSAGSFFWRVKFHCWVYVSRICGSRAPEPNSPARVLPWPWNAVATLMGLLALPVKVNVRTMGGFRLSVVQEFVISGV